MNKHLEKICASSDYDEIYRIMESKTIKPSLTYKDVSLTKIDFEYLKQYTKLNILSILNKGSKIPDSLIKLSLILGDEYVENLKTTVSTLIVSRSSADLSLFVQEKFHDLSSLSEICSFLEKYVESIITLYENLPLEWNIDLSVVNRCLVIIKQAVCELFFNSEIDPVTYSQGVVSTINFEKKLSTFFKTKKCCSSVGNEIHCIHKNMLSKIFIPYIDLFFENYLFKMADKLLNQNILEKNIIKDYVDFFKTLETVYAVTSHFEEKDVFRVLAESTDQCVCRLLQKTKVEESISRMIPIISTILFTQNALEEFFNSLYDRYQVDHESKALMVSGKLERSQVTKIEKEFNINFTGNIKDFESTVERFFNSQEIITEEVRLYLLEICMSLLFSKITNLKMNPYIARTLLKDIQDLEISIKFKFKYVPCIGLIEEYLTIFTYPADPCDKFIENFNTVASGRFEFNQILKMLEDQKTALKLYETYKDLNK